MKPKTLVLFAVAGACGLLALVGFQAMQKAQPEAKIETASVLVAVSEIGAGAVLVKDENVRFKEMAVASLPPDPVLTEEQFLERSAMLPIIPGEMISMSKLTEPGVSGVGTRIPKGWRVFTISADDRITASGMLHAGDRVDVLVTFKSRTQGGAAVTKTKTLLEYVEIFATDDRTATTAADAESNKAKNVSLLLTPEQVNFVILAQSKGALQLSWRHRMDDQLVDTGDVDEELLNELTSTAGLYDDRPLYDMASTEELGSAHPVRPQDIQDGREERASEFLDHVDETQPAQPQQPAVAQQMQAPPAQPGWSMQVFNGNRADVQQFAIVETSDESSTTPSNNWVSDGLKSLFGGGQKTSDSSATVN
ncbi:MAG: Flp pilus assembly protein CpaB [Planctomycetaceae bacterium]|nr:Flp pilus assembly protein CpaB [Planctomycetaceae bacterium]